jgi:hypothetical protein
MHLGYEIVKLSFLESMLMVLCVVEGWVGEKKYSVKLVQVV